MSDCSVHYQYVTSDHKPISVNYSHLLQHNGDSASVRNDVVTNCKVLPDWSKRDAHCIGSYQYELELALARINIPSLLLDGGADLMSDAVEKITTRRREGVGVVVETKEESRRTFQQKSV